MSLLAALEIWPLLPGEPPLDVDQPAATEASSRVYVLCFERAYHHARHYVGIAEDGDVQRRLAQHLAGQGSPLVRAVVAAGIAVHLVLAIPGDRGLERRLKNRHGHGPSFCPRCKSHPWRAAAAQACAGSVA